VHVNESGFFAHVIPLEIGENKFDLLLDDGQSHADVLVRREKPPAPIGVNELKLRSFAPSQNLGVKAGDIISLSVHGTPDSKIEVEIGQRRILLCAPTKSSIPDKRARTMRPYASENSHDANKSNINHGQDADYGEVYQRHPAHPPDLYTGFYKVMPEDRWQGVSLKFKLNHAGKETSLTSNNRITTISQPLIAQTSKAETTVRLGPGLARTTPLAAGIRLFIDGWVGDQMRISYAADKHVFIDRKDLQFENGAPGEKIRESAMAPQAVTQTINIRNDSYGQLVSIPLSQRLPYQIEQKLSPNVLVIRIYGATADTDWITTPGETEHMLRSERSSGSETSDDSDDSAAPIDYISWKQPADEVYEVTVHLKKDRQWGYKVFYDGTSLCLDIKREVAVASSGLPLQGIKVCLDPGHGGSETGSIGCSGAPESKINLAIAVKLKTFLEKQGATVIMTRQREDENVPIYDRVDRATNQQADFLISIHNNALPDGRDPWQEHGSTSFWYHPQSMELSRSLQHALVQKVGFPDLGARWQNLALVRGTAMPSVLVEVGFMINPDEFAKLIDEDTQTKIAEALGQGLTNYVHPESSEHENRKAQAIH
jgi:N-acetylmuramoyl-L-alanine amidase